MSKPTPREALYASSRRIHDALPHSLVVELLTYEANTGLLFWKRRPPALFSDGQHSAVHSCEAWNARHAGMEALSAINSAGYKAGTMLGIRVVAHRVVWCLVHGEWPNQHIDHINGNKLDNRTSNLRHVEFSENMLNLPRRADSLSGVTGVNFDRPTGKWRARYQINKRRICLGLFETAEQAEEAVINARAVAGFLPSHGRAA